MHPKRSARSPPTTIGTLEAPEKPFVSFVERLNLAAFATIF